MREHHEPVPLSFNDSMADTRFHRDDCGVCHTVNCSLQSMYVRSHTEFDIQTLGQGPKRPTSRRQDQRALRKRQLGKYGIPVQWEGIHEMRIHYEPRLKAVSSRGWAWRILCAGQGQLSHRGHDVPGGLVEWR